MVGVPKSTGCFICRKRKIKCDETWPHCLNCKKNGKCCPGPPARHTFKDLGPTLSVKGTSTSEEDVSGNTNQRSKKLTQLNEKWSANGAVFQKWRMTPRSSDASSRRLSRSPRSSSSASPPQGAIVRFPSPSQHQELARALVDALNTGSVGHRMSAFGPFLREVPSRIGYNAALDAASACLVNAHSSMVHHKGASEIVSPALYLRAVQSLQTCLEDPAHGMSSNTLCASVLLGIVEALAGPRVGNRYLAHVGGAGRLMELQGPAKCQDPFAKEILRFNRGGIIITSMYERKPCFLTSPEWRDLAFNNAGLTFEDCLYTEILQRMADFPALLRELKDLEQATMQPLDDILLGVDLSINLGEVPLNLDDPIDFSQSIYDPALDFLMDPYPIETSGASGFSTTQTTLLDKLYASKEALHILGGHLNAKLMDGSAAIELPSIEEGSPIPTAFHFTGWRVTVAYNCFWALNIITNKIIMKLLPPFDPTYPILEAECRTMANEICKTWEDSWASKPIGAFHTGFSFVMAYEFCETEVQEWIIKGLNKLLDCQHVQSFRWSHDVIQGMSGRLAGEGPDLKFTSVKK